MKTEEDTATDDREAALFKYVNWVENVNAELLKSLKMCIDLLTPIRDLVNTPDQWEERINYAQQIAGEGPVKSVAFFKAVVARNYFEHIVVNWDQIADAMKEGSNWQERARFILEKSDYLRATKGVLEMTEDARKMLDKNSKKWMPK